MLVRRAAPDYQAPFELLDFTVIVEARGADPLRSQAMVKLRIGAEVMHTAAEGDGSRTALGSRTTGFVHEHVNHRLLKRCGNVVTRHIRIRAHVIDDGGLHPTE